MCHNLCFQDLWRFYTSLMDLCSWRHLNHLVSLLLELLELHIKSDWMKKIWSSRFTVNIFTIDFLCAYTIHQWLLFALCLSAFPAHLIWRQYWIFLHTANVRERWLPVLRLFHASVNTLTSCEWIAAVGIRLALPTRTLVWLNCQGIRVHTRGIITLSARNMWAVEMCPGGLWC